MTRTILIALFPNAGFEVLTSYRLVIALGQHYDVIDWSDYQREKSITISKHDVCGNAMHKRLNVVNFRLRFIITTVATIIFWRVSGLAKKISFDNQSAHRRSQDF